jgi:diguanylate cyclase (GGDEF)-like protein
MCSNIIEKLEDKNVLTLCSYNCRIKIIKLILGGKMEKHNIDELTGINNRIGFIEIIEQQISEGNSESIQIAMVHINGITSINNEFGFSEGDNALKDLAKILNEKINHIGNIARYGSDEFIVSLPNNINIGEVMETINSAIDLQNIKGERSYKLKMGYVHEPFPTKLIKELDINKFLNDLDKRIHEH